MSEDTPMRDQPEPQETKHRSSGVVKAAIKRYSGSRPGQGGLPKQRAVFDLDHNACLPGAFSEDLEITLAGLTPALEDQALQLAGANPMKLAFAYAQLSIELVNGEPLGPGEDEVFWELLGTAGRQIVVKAYNEFLGDTVDATGKAVSTLRRV